MMTEINKQYELLCAKIGDIEVKVRMYNTELEELHKQVLALNELAALKQRQIEADNKNSRG